jgi:cobalt/nickel transport system permease protein
VSRNFIERTIVSLMGASEYAAAAERTAAMEGVLQGIDPRVKVAGMFALVIAVAAAGRLRVILALFAVALALAVLSQVSFRKLGGWVWMPVLFFTGTIAAPAVFLTPGTPVFSAGGIAMTAQGLRSAAFLVARAETAATLSTLLVLTTPWPWVLKSLRAFGCPIVLVAVLGMTYRYIFVMLQTAFDMFESRKSRTVGVLAPADRRRLAASAVGVLLSKSFQLSGDVHLAMQSRGFRGEVYILDNFHSRAADWFWLAGAAVLALAAFWWGR